MTEAHHSCGLGAPVGYVLKTRRASPSTTRRHGDFAGMALIGELYPIDVAMLPMGPSSRWITAGGEACALLKAKAVIPMHYGTFRSSSRPRTGSSRNCEGLAGQRPIVLAGEETTVVGV